MPFFLTSRIPSHAIFPSPALAPILKKWRLYFAPNSIYLGIAFFTPINIPISAFERYGCTNFKYSISFNGEIELFSSYAPRPRQFPNSISLILLSIKPSIIMVVSFASNPFPITFAPSRSVQSINLIFTPSFLICFLDFPPTTCIYMYNSDLILFHSLLLDRVDKSMRIPGRIH